MSPKRTQPEPQDVPDAGPGACRLAPLPAAPLCDAPIARLGTAPPGEARFVDRWAELGLDAARGWRVNLADVDGDGYPELLNIERPNGRDKQHLFRNVSNPDGGAGRFFVEATDESGLRVNRDGGVGQTATLYTLADVDNDGDPDVFQAETVHGDYPRSQADRSRILRNTGADGGYVFERPELSATGIARELNGSFGELAEQSAYPSNHGWLFQQLADHTFVNVTPTPGIAADLVASNGSTVGDFDRDGDLDFATGSVHNVNGVAAPGDRDQVHLYENLSPREHAFLNVSLRGTTANRQGIGARVTVTAGCVTQVREIPGGGGTFGAQVGAFAHFGLGAATRVDRLEVRWPTSPPHVEVFTDVAVNQFLTVTEGSRALQCEGPR